MKASLRRALELDPDLAEGHASLSLLHPVVLSLGLTDDQVSQLIGTRKGEKPLLLMPIGVLA